MAQVRQLTVADAAAFRDIRLEGLADDPRAFSADWGAESVQDIDWFAARIASSQIFAVDGAGGHLLGITGLSIPQNPKQCHRGHIWGVYVRPETRGSGIATALLAAAIGAARGREPSGDVDDGLYDSAGGSLLAGLH